jgi:hypothetical protein
MAVVDKQRIGWVGWVFKLNKVLKNVGGTAIGAMKKLDVGNIMRRAVDSWKMK